VLRTDGYGGSYSYDYDDARSGYAGCAVCRMVKQDVNCENVNADMPDDGSRIVRRLCLDVSGAESAKHTGHDGLLKRIAYYRSSSSLAELVDRFHGEKAFALLYKELAG